MSKWSEHVKRYAKKHKMSYREASMDSKCKESYRKKRMSPRKMSPRKMSPKKKRMNLFPFVRSFLPRGNDELIIEAIQSNDYLQLRDGLLNQVTNINFFYQGTTPLIEACKVGNPFIVELLIERGANLDLEGLVQGVTYTPLTLVIDKDLSASNSLARLLVDRGADVNKAISQGRHIANTPLCFASRRENLTIMRILLNAGANPNQLCQHNMSPIFAVIIPTRGTYRGSTLGDNVLRCVELLLDRGADVNHVMDNGNTPLIFSCKEGYLGLVRLFLDRGANINSADNSGLTSLHIAVRGSNEGLVRILLERGANPNYSDSHGYTALHLAVLEKLPDIAEMLLSRGANPNLAADDGSTPLEIARTQEPIYPGGPDLFSILRDYQFGVEEENNSSRLAIGSARNR